MAQQIKLRGDTDANWTSVNPVLADREPGYDVTNGVLKIGDGVSAWTSLTGISLAGAVMNSDTSTADMLFVIDEDDMTTNSSTKIPTQQSVKAYVDASVTAGSPVVAIATYSSGWPSRPTADIVFWVSEDPLATTPGAATGDDVVVLPAQVTTPAAVSNSTTAYTLDDDDDGTTSIHTNASLVTVTVPTDGADDLRNGFRHRIFAAGAAGVQLGVSGITLLGASPFTKIAQNGYMDLEKTASANTWLVMGATLAGAAGFGGDTYTYEEGTNGVDIGTGTGVTAVTASAPKYSTAAAFHGSLGYNCIGQQALFYAAPADDFSGSVYVEPHVNGASSSNRIITLQTAADAEICALRLHSTAGVISLVNSANTIAVSATTTWAVNDLFRFDWQADYNDGADTLALSVRIFKGANVEGTTPDETISNTFTSVTAPCTKVRVGNYNTGTWDFYFDTLRLNDALEWIGPL
jgi:hypothetical protein